MRPHLFRAMVVELFMADFMPFIFAIGSAAPVLACAAALLFFVKARQAREYAALLDDAVNTPAHGLLFFDERQRLRKANSQAARFLPLLREEGIKNLNLGRVLDYLYDHAVEPDQSLQNTIARSAQRLPTTGFREVVCWDGGRHCLAEAQKTPGGRTVLILVDISSQKKQEEDVLRLSRRNQELLEAIEAAENGIVISNPREPGHPLIFANAAFSRFTGLPKEELLTQGWNVLLRRFGNEDAAQILREALEEGRRADVELAAHGESPRWFSVKLTPVAGKNGAADLFVGIFSETTEMKMREAEFYRARKLEALGQLAAGVAHDFNNVLSIIDGYAHMIAGGLPEGSEARNHTDKILKASARGAALIRRMLTFGRHKIVTDSVIDLARTLKEQHDLIRPLFDASVEFSMRLPEEPIRVECAADNITQIMMNLCINARDAMPDGGKITVELAEAKGRELPPLIPQKERGKRFACLRVADTGSGIEPAVMERIFDPFFTTREQGTGLGLSMVYGIVRENHGYIRAESTPGRGTVMTVHLPVTDKEIRRQISGDPEDSGTISLKGFTALVAEDEPDLLMLVGGMLERLGMNVLAASSGHKALAVQDNYEGEIDILLTDVVMPEMDGVKLAELVQALRPGIRTVFMSGYPAHGADAPVKLPEGACFMAKPVRYNALAALIYRLLTDRGGDARAMMAAGENAYWDNEAAGEDEGGL